MVYNNKIVRVILTDDDNLTWQIRLMRSSEVRNCFGETMIIKPYKWYELQRFITIPSYYLSEILSKSFKSSLNFQRIKARTNKWIIFAISSALAAVIGEITLKVIRVFYPEFPHFKD
jgi:hypothetical protein